MSQLSPIERFACEVLKHLNDGYHDTLIRLGLAHEVRTVRLTPDVLKLMSVYDGETAPNPPALVVAPRQGGQATTFSAQGVELLRIALDGFYVRGVKLPQDEREARAVHDAFIEWLAAHGFPVAVDPTKKPPYPFCSSPEKCIAALGHAVLTIAPRPECGGEGKESGK